jgi:hypothetical protein
VSGRVLLEGPDSCDAAAAAGSRSRADDHARAGPGQLVRDLQAHAPTRAGHQGDPALDADHEAAGPSGSRGLSPR